MFLSKVIGKTWHIFISKTFLKNHVFLLLLTTILLVPHLLQSPLWCSGQSVCVDKYISNSKAWGRHWKYTYPLWMYFFLGFLSQIKGRDQEGLSNTYLMSLVILKYFIKKCTVLLPFLKIKSTSSVGVMNRLFWLWFPRNCRSVFNVLAYRLM